MATPTPSDEFLKAILCCSFQIGSSLVNFGFTGIQEKDSIELTSELVCIRDWIINSDFSETHSFIKDKLPQLINSTKISEVVQKRYENILPCE